MCAAIRDGGPVVLKLTPRGHPDDELLASEAVTLDFWRPTGAAIELLGSARRRLHAAARARAPRRPLLHSGLSWEEMLAELGRLARRLHAAGTPPPAILPDERLRRGLDRRTAELGELLLPSPDDVLVHLDLHPGNALRVDGGWKAIDPHGARADRNAEIWALICPEAPALPDDPVDAKRSARHRLEAVLGSRGARRGPGGAPGHACARAPRPCPPTSMDDPGWAERLRRTARALSPD